MNQNSNRRDFLKAGVATAAGMTLLPFLQSIARAESVAAGPRKKALFFTKSCGYQHSVITRPKDDPAKLAYAEQIITDLGAKHGFDVTCSKDGTVFTPEKIAETDVFVFYTSGDLTKDSDKFDTKKDGAGKNVPDPERLLHKEPAMSPAAKQAFLDAIHGGKGFVGFHSASDTFHSPKHERSKHELLRNVDEQGKDAFDPYIVMLGGEFILHGSQQEASLRAIDSKFPGAAGFVDARFREEWYALKNFSPDLHVILAMDTKGMTGEMYQRPIYPQTWARLHGKGRVFFTAMGHREDVWQKPEFIAMTVGALNWASGRIDADVTPNIKTATPDVPLAG